MELRGGPSSAVDEELIPPKLIVILQVNEVAVRCKNRMVNPIEIGVREV
jgi:hypothetical protein